MFDPKWEEIFQLQEWGKYPPECVIRFVARNWYRADRKAIRLLDVGCGPGACTWYMAREGFTVSGIDGSPTAIRRAEERLASEGLSAELRVGDFTKTLPWDAGTFDGVIDNAALCCNSLENWRSAITEILRVLKPDGKMFSACFTEKSSRVRDDAFIQYVSEEQVRGLYRFPQLSIERMTVANHQYCVDSFLITATR